MRVVNDFSTSVHKALEEIDHDYMSYPGLVVCGTHSPHDTDDLIDLITDAWVTGTPFLGICFGHQLAAIVWARLNGIPDATSEEFGQGTFVVKQLPQLKVGLHDGESYWHNYEVVIGWQKPSHFFTAQFHPEYQSTPDKPHPLLVSFLNYAKLAMQNRA